MLLVSGIVAEPVSGIVKSLPWDLTDLIAYLLLGTSTGFIALAAFYGVERVTGVVESHIFLVAAATIVFGYPMGIVTYNVGRQYREWLRRAYVAPTVRGRGDDYANELLPSVDAVIGKVLLKGAPSLPPIALLRVGVLLAGKHLPPAAAAVHRQNSMFSFFVTLVGATLLSMLTLEVSALLRLVDAIAGSATAYAAWGLVPLGILFVAEHAARNANMVIVEVMADVAVAVSAVLGGEVRR
jgi:hypothetical protein